MKFAVFRRASCLLVLQLLGRHRLELYAFSADLIATFETLLLLEARDAGRGFDDAFGGGASFCWSAVLGRVAFYWIAVHVLCLCFDDCRMLDLVAANLDNACRTLVFVEFGGFRAPACMPVLRALQEVANRKSRLRHIVTRLGRW